MERIIANFHTLFNLLTTIVLLPLTNVMVKLANIIIPDKVSEEDDQMRLHFLDNRLIETPAVAVGNIRKEVNRMSDIAKENLNLSMEMLLSADVDNAKKIQSNEKILNYLNHAITTYMTKLIGKELSVEDDKKLSSYFHVVSDLERVGDYSENIMEYSQRLRNQEVSFSKEAICELTDVLNALNDLFDKTLTAFDRRDVTALDAVAEVEEKIDQMTSLLEGKHIERVKLGNCDAQLGSVYLQTVSNLERVGDHVTNVAFSITKYRKVVEQTAKNK